MNKIYSLPIAMLGATLLLGSCTSSGSKSGSAGELDNGLFHYRCATTNDAACASSLEPEFPEAIAVGGRFLLEYEPKGNNPDGTVRSAVPERVSRNEDEFTVLVSGFSAMLAKDAAGDILDIKHIRGRDVAELKADVAGNIVDQVFMQVGSESEVLAIPFDDLDNALAGSIEYTWSVDNEAVIRLVSTAQAGSVVVEALALGSANLQVTHGALTATIPVTVETGEPTTSGSGTGDSSTGTSGTGGSDTGTGGSDTGTGSSTGGAT